MSDIAWKDEHQISAALPHQGLTGGSYLYKLVRCLSRAMYWADTAATAMKMHCKKNAHVLRSKNLVGEIEGKHLSRWGRVILALTDSVHDCYCLRSLVTVCALKGFPRVCVIATSC